MQGNPATDEFDLARFVSAQEDTFDTALDEIHSGAKRSHWMWFVFPQLKGLGRSRTAEFYGLSGPAEARAYLAHEQLGPRLRKICQALCNLRNVTAHEVFGSPDDMKLHSCVTLFAQLSNPDSVFHAVLEQYFDGRPDRRTIELLQASATRQKG